MAKRKSRRKATQNPIPANKVSLPKFKAQVDRIRKSYHKIDVRIAKGNMKEALKVTDDLDKSAEEKRELRRLYERKKTN